MSPVYRSLTRPKLIRGIEWQLYYLLLLGCLADAFYAPWEPRRLLLLPLIYLGPYTLFRWAGKHDTQWSEVYPQALRNRAIFYAQSDPHLSERLAAASSCCSVSCIARRSGKTWWRRCFIRAV